MTTDMKKLREKIVERGTTLEAVSGAIGMDKSTFYRKIGRQGASFSIGQVFKMVEAIPLTKEEALAIFFADDVA